VDLLIDSITVSYKVLQLILCFPTYELDYEVNGLMLWTMINNMLVLQLLNGPGIGRIICQIYLLELLTYC
jgi:hypothetical protein